MDYQLCDTLLCQCYNWIALNIGIKFTVTFIVSIAIALNVGYEKGLRTRNKKTYHEGFVNGISYLMIRFKTQHKIAFDIVYEKDKFIHEALNLTQKTPEYRTPDDVDRSL